MTEADIIAVRLRECWVLRSGRLARPGLPPLQSGEVKCPHPEVA